MSLLATRSGLPGRSLVDRSIEGHIDAAIVQLRHAKALCRRDQAFSIERLGDARMCIAAARLAIAAEPTPLARRIVQ